MTNERVLEVYYPINNDNWPILVTDASFYSLRIGGYKKIYLEKIDMDKYNKLKIPFSGMKIGKQFTDEENIYIHISDKFIVEAGLLNFNPDSGNTYGVTYHEVSDFQVNLENDQDIYELVLDGDNSFIKNENNY